MKKKVTLVLAALFCFMMFSGCTPEAAGGIGPDANANNVNKSAPPIVSESETPVVQEEKNYWKGEPWQTDLSDGRLFVQMTKEESWKRFSYRYTPADFPEVNCGFVQDASVGKVLLIKRGHYEYIPEFRKKLILSLTGGGRDNMYNAIRTLEKRPDVFFGRA
jgi:hypothetical protein